MDNINGGLNGITAGKIPDKKPLSKNEKPTESLEDFVRKDIKFLPSEKDLTESEINSVNNSENNKETASREAKWQGNMQQERDNIETRFAQAESEVRRLMEELRLQLEEERERERERAKELEGPGIKEEYEALKTAVLDYVIAYGAVDVQVALLRAHRDTGGEVLDNLRRSLEEQANALHNLRTLARTLQNAERPGRE